MPILGYGVYQVTKEECEKCVLDALKVGYTAIDTAQSYFNEEEVGNAIAKSGIPREEIFLTTKVWVEHYGYENARKSVEESMRKLKTDYLDLVLLHQPFAEVSGKPERLLKILPVGECVLCYLYLDISRAVVVAALRAISAAPAAYVPGQQLRSADCTFFVPAYDSMRTHIRIRAVEIILVGIFPADIRRVDVAFQIRIVRPGAVNDYPRRTSRRHFPRR